VVSEPTIPLSLVTNVLDPGSSLGQLIKIIRESQMELVVDKLTEFSSSTDEELRDISGLGIFTLVELLPLEFNVNY
jgi:hypothetical protein